MAFFFIHWSSYQFLHADPMHGAVGVPSLTCLSCRINSVCRLSTLLVGWGVRSWVWYSLMVSGVETLRCELCSRAWKPFMWGLPPTWGGWSWPRHDHLGESLELLMDDECPGWWSMNADEMANSLIALKHFTHFRRCPSSFHWRCQCYYK